MIQASDKIKLMGLIKNGFPSYYQFHEGMSKTLTDDDILLYFYEVCNNFFQSDSIPMKRACTCIFSINKILSNALNLKLKLNHSIIEKVRSLGISYNVYLERTGEIKDENLAILLDDLVKLVIDYYLECANVLDGPDKENIAENEIKELKEQIVSLEKNINNKQKELSTLEEKYRKKEVQVEEYKVSLKSVQQSLKRVTREKSRLENRIKKLEENFLSYKEDKEKLKELESLKSSNQKLIQEKELLVQKEEQEKVLDAFLLEELIAHTEGISLQDLFCLLNKREHLYSKDLIYERLMKLGRLYNLVNCNKITYPFLYQISSPKIEENKDFFLSIENNAIDILFVSDFHIKNFDEKTLSLLDSLYEYCVKQGVQLVVNGGDFFSKNVYCSNRKTLFSYIEEQMKDFTTHYPFDNSITNALMGGNHDQQYCALGIDIIKEMCNSRMDFIDLGYNHAYLHFGTGEDSIALHHPSQRFESFIKKDFYDSSSIQSTMNHYLLAANKNEKSIYFSLLGHFHKSSVDFSRAFACIPSLFKDRVQNGAWHLKIYFDENKKIKNIVFFPLIYNKEWIAINEINYQKFTLKK